MSPPASTPPGRGARAIALAAALAPAAAPAFETAPPSDALALLSATGPAVPVTLSLVGGAPETSDEGADVALLELDSEALSVALALEPWELVAGLGERPDAGARAAWRATFGTAAPTAYRGGVPGRDRSWARLLEVDGAWRGHLAAGGTLWRVDPVAGAPATDEGIAHVARRVAVGVPPPAVADADADAEVLRIGIVVDSRFDERHGGRGLERALAIVNGVDGLFREGFGVGLAVEAVRVHDDPGTDPLREAGDTVETVLEAFRLARDADPELAEDLALVHLFTGLDDARGAVGLGYVDGACRADGWDTALSTPFAFDVLLAAHEMAHVVGAPHDDDPSCAGRSTPADLMWPTLSEASRAGFSACSVEAVRRTLESGCLADGRVVDPG